MLSTALLRCAQLERVPLLLERSEELIRTTGASILQRKLDPARDEYLARTRPDTARSAVAAHQ